MVALIIAILFLSALIYLAKIAYASFAKASNPKNASCCSTKSCLPKP